MDEYRKEIFKKINSAHKELNKFEAVVKISRGANTDFEKSVNDMYDSPEAGGGVIDNAVSVSTGTIIYDEECQTDVITIKIYGPDDEEKEAHLSKDDAIDLIRYLATAVSLLRN